MVRVRNTEDERTGGFLEGWERQQKSTWSKGWQGQFGTEHS